MGKPKLDFVGHRIAGDLFFYPSQLTTSQPCFATSQLTPKSPLSTIYTTCLTPLPTAGHISRVADTSLLLMPRSKMLSRLQAKVFLSLNPKLFQRSASLSLGRYVCLSYLLLSRPMSVKSEHLKSGGSIDPYQSHEFSMNLVTFTNLVPGRPMGWNGKSVDDLLPSFHEDDKKARQRP